jgi:hypothetical protein
VPTIRPRVTLAALMTAVGLVAVDLAAARAFLGHDEYYGWNLGCLAEVAPAVVASEVALLCLACSRGRAFWVGFLTAGALAGVSVVLALADPRTETTTFKVSGMTTTVYPGGPTARLWYGYDSFVSEGLERLHYSLDGTTSIRSFLTRAVVFALPQWLAAVAGGLLARWAWRAKGRHATPVPASST